ncbi:ACT domain-containing protein [Caldicellulosiruptor acetigenus]|uniref:ACT domain-containing protein n=1 Tax=Caldicellulosiruptor acetigenus TaxID=301953 RepID=UPI0004224917|nr:ACT domain-containing protein [Caldicellulosiruptor acetigenus]WAM36970.1 ACT domain-containing protein [Caldicellulosiruptor acetigenus]
MLKKDATYYIVEESVLPEVFLKVVKAKELLEKGEVKAVNEAVKMVGISRSAFYKYKDCIFPFFESSHGKIITLALVLKDIPGILSKILNIISETNANILTINQNIPLGGIATVSISIRTSGMTKSVKDLILEIEKVDGVKKIEILGREEY